MDRYLCQFSPFCCRLPRVHCAAGQSDRREALFGPISLKENMHAWRADISYRQAAQQREPTCTGAMASFLAHLSLGVRGAGKSVLVFFTRHKWSACVSRSAHDMPEKGETCAAGHVTPACAVTWLISRRCMHAFLYNQVALLP